MRISKCEDERMVESREMLHRKMANCIDSTRFVWNELEYGKIYSVLKFSVEQIKQRGYTLSDQIILADSACHLSALLITRLIQVDMTDAMMLALGSYIEQEARSNKKDQWRDESFNTLYKHLRDEIVEIKNSEGNTIKLHNCLDACALSAMLALTLESY